MILLLIGPPACGKGTVGKLLSNTLKIPMLSPGLLLRNVPESSSWYKRIHDDMDKGFLVSKDIVSAILKETSESPEFANGYILEGWFRDLASKDYFYPKFDKVIFLNISRDISLRRSTSRRVCEQAGHTYNLELIKPRLEGICDIDGSKLITRTDDSVEVFNTRYADFENMTLEVLDFFRNQGLLLEIDASRTPEEIANDILGKLTN